MRNKVMRDPGFWLLLAVNAYVIIHYMQYPNSIHTIIALFWIQSVLIGIFNALDIFTLTHTVESSFTVNDSKSNNKGCAGSFFLLHYGGFHLVYLIFLTVKVIDMRELDWSFLILTFWLMVFGSVAGFIHNKIRNRTEAVNIGNMFFLPYIRIVPMHLVILVPAFWSISAPIIFLSLKVVADVVMYIVIQKSVFKPMNNNMRINP